MELFGLSILAVFIIFGSLALNFAVWIWSLIDCINGTKDYKTPLTIGMILIAPISWVYALFITDSKPLKKFVVISTLSIVGSVAVIVNRAPKAAEGRRQMDAVQKLQKIAKSKAFPKIRLGAFEPIRAVNIVQFNEHDKQATIGSFTHFGFDSEKALDSHKNLLAIAGKTNSLFGITGHPSLSFGKIDANTGIFQDLPLPAGFSWPRALAFDSTAKKVLVLSRGNAHFYDLKTKTYKSTPSIARLTIGGLTFNPKQKIYYGLIYKYRVGFDEVAQINQNGAVLRTKKLDRPIPSDEIESKIQLYSLPSGKLIALSFDEDQKMEIPYLIDPKSGTVKMISLQSH